jgi:hypothetical protein
MCMITACITPEFGVLAADSAFYEPNTRITSYTAPKLFKAGNKLATFVGSPQYMVGIDVSQFSNSLEELAKYLQNHLLTRRPEIEKDLQTLPIKPDDMKARLCLFVLGEKDNKPTLLQLNSFKDFKPEYLVPSTKPEFASIYYGDDEIKKQIFSASTKYMESRLDNWKGKVDPGIIAEILTRGIYKKADLEEKQYGAKYAGGAVSVAGLLADNQIYGLSNIKF